MIHLARNRSSIPSAKALVGVALLFLEFVATAGEWPVVRWQGRTMGSPYLVQVVGTNLPTDQVEAVRGEVEKALEEVNRQMSHYQADSELSRFNASVGDIRFRVSPEFARVVRFSLELSRRSGGAFDPTLSPLVNLWGFGEKTNRAAVPSAAALEAARRLVGWGDLGVTSSNELWKAKPGLSLNLSAVAKGFGVDEMGRALRRRGLTNYYVSIAGEVLVSGVSPRGTNWLVGITAPVENWREGDPMAAGVALSDRALSTSGDYQKFFRNEEGMRLSHILDPRTGRPVQHDLGGVTVVASDGMTADGLATTLFVLGPKAGLEFIESWTNAAALFIIREGEGGFRRVVSSRFAGMATLQEP